MKTIAAKIAELRVLVGFLGEKGQSNWWSSEFFSASASAFLAPIFNRTPFLAQYQGVTAAAAKVHDEAIGVGRLYHLFRLPIGLEQASTDALHDAVFIQSLQGGLASRDNAMARLAKLAAGNEKAAPGPVSIGQMSEDLESELQQAAGIYHTAFTAGIQTYPYMREFE